MHVNKQLYLELRERLDHVMLLLMHRVLTSALCDSSELSE